MDIYLFKLYPKYGILVIYATFFSLICTGVLCHIYPWYKFLILSLIYTSPSGPIYCANVTFFISPLAYTMLIFWFGSNTTASLPLLPIYI